MADPMRTAREHWCDSIGSRQATVGVSGTVAGVVTCNFLHGKAIFLISKAVSPVAGAALVLRRAR
jgi:hypothetical protein